MEFIKNLLACFIVSSAILFGVGLVLVAVFFVINWIMFTFDWFIALISILLLIVLMVSVVYAIDETKNPKKEEK